MIVEARRVVKRYGATTALAGVDYPVEEAGVHVVVGPNGSGKSTLLSIIAGAERPDSGVVSVLGLDPWRDSGRLARRVSALLDRTRVHPWLSGLELARLVSGARGVRWEDVLELAERLGVTRYWRRSVAGYSSGMLRRLLLLLALAGFPELIILDEPFQALDPGAASVVTSIIGEARRSGSTVIVATHIAPGDLLSIASTVARMELGRITARGPLASVEVSGCEVYVRVECRAG